MTKRAGCLIAIAVSALALHACASDDATPSLTIDLTRLQPGTVEQIDEYPCYMMRFSGGYGFRDYLRRGEGSATSAVRPARTRATGWACTVFAAMTGPDGPLLGRNFDFFHRAGMLLLTEPPDGFSSLSMVDLHYCGFAGGVTLREVQAQSDRLRQAPYVPFDGVNEKGVAIGLMAVPSAQPPFDPAKASLYDLALIRLVLDQAESAEHAVTLLRGYNYRAGDYPVHFLIADPSGAAVIVEYVGGDIKLTRNTGPYLVATNFVVYGSGAPAEAPCTRYRTAYATLSQHAGRLSMLEAMDTLATVRQDITMWSVVYSLQNRQVRLVLGGNYANVHAFVRGF
jgi:hypothetical protein